MDQFNPVAGAGLGLNRNRQRIFRPRPRYTLEQKIEAVRLYLQGMSCRQVARVIRPNCSPTNPLRWRRQLLHGNLRAPGRRRRN